MGLAKFDAKLRQWRTLGLQADVSGSRLKNRTERNSVESFLGLKNGGFAPFFLRVHFVVRKNHNGRHLN